MSDTWTTPFFSFSCTDFLCIFLHSGPFANGFFLFLTEFLLTCGHFRRFSDVKSDLLVFFLTRVHCDDVKS